MSQELKGEFISSRRFQIDYDRIFNATYVQPFPEEFTLNPSKVKTNADRERIFDDFYLRQIKFEERKQRMADLVEAEAEERQREQAPFHPEINSISKEISDKKLHHAIENLDPASFYKKCLQRGPRPGSSDLRALYKKKRDCALLCSHSQSKKTFAMRPSLSEERLATSEQKFEQIDLSERQLSCAAYSAERRKAKEDL